MPSISDKLGWRQVLHVLRPTHRHTAFSASLLLMASTLVSRLIGLAKTKYIAICSVVVLLPTLSMPRSNSRTWLHIS